MNSKLNLLHTNFMELKLPLDQSGEQLPGSIWFVKKVKTFSDKLIDKISSFLRSLKISQKFSD